VHQQITDAVRVKDAPKEAAMQQAIATGAKMPSTMGQEMTSALDSVVDEATRGGTLSTADVAALKNFALRLKFEPDPATGQPGRLRDWSNPREVFNLTRTNGLLSEEAEFGKDTPKIVAQVSRRMRAVAVDNLGKVAPEVTRLSREQSELVKAREAANDLVMASRKGTLTTFRGIMSSNAPTLVSWIAARELFGMNAAMALGGVIVFKRLMESVSSRTLRAALRAKLLERQEAALAALQGTAGAAGGGTGVPRGTPPYVPPGQQLRGVPGLPAGPQGGGAAPTPTGPGLAGASVTQPPVAPSATLSAGPPEPLSLPASATRARAGSGDYVRGARPGDVSAAESSTMATAQRKAMLDRLDDLLARYTKPKSGMDRAALQHEIAELKQLLAGEDVGTKHAGAAKRIADRERLATKRAADAAKQPVAPAGEAPPPGGVAPQMSQEDRAVQLDLGYKALAKFDGGPEMVKALQKVAKELKGTEYDELQQLKDSVKALIDAGERPKEVQ